MASNIVRATLLADAQRFKAGFKEGERAVGGFDKKITNTANLVKGVLAGAAVVAVKRFADDSKRAFSELEQSVGGTEAVFGDASGAIDRFSKTSAQSIGLSESAFRTATTSIGGQLKRMTGDVDFAAEHSIELTRVAADLAATYGGTTAEAVQALGAAFRGEADPAERFNLDLKQGAVNAKAVELGLAKTTSEVDANAKAQAILALITEQSADAQGRFEREADTLAGTEQRLNAQLENNKALVGRAIQGAYRGAMPLVGGLSNLVADLAIAFMVSTDEMTKGEAALIRYTNATGELVDSLAKLLPLIEEQIEKEGRRASQQAQNEGGNVEAIDNLAILRERLDEMLVSLDLNHEELVAWNEDFRRSPEYIKLTAEELEVVEEVTRKHTIAAKAQEDQIAENKLRMEAMTRATDDTAEATDEATSALERFESEVRSQTDPLYALQEAERAVEEAKLAIIEAEQEFGRESPQYVDALLNLARKNDDLTAAQIKVGEQSGMTAETYRAHLRSMGQFTSEQIEQIMAEFARVNAFQFANKWINVGARIRGDLVPGTGGRRQHGGHVNAGEPVIVGEAGPEPFIPDTSGRVIPNHKARAGGGATVNFYINALDPQSAAKAVVQAIETYKRNNGGRLPF